MSFFSKKTSLNLAKFYKAITFLLIAGIPQASADNVAIIGGFDLIGNNPAYAAFISPSGDVVPLVFTGEMATSGVIQSVSMSASGNSLIGGLTGSRLPYAALVSPSGDLNVLAFSGATSLHGTINSVAINSSGNGIIGGRDTTGPIFAALVPPSGNPLNPLLFPTPILSGGNINSVAINESGNCLIGGQGYYNSQPAYAAFVSPSGAMTSLTLTGGVATNGTISSVSINSSGNGIIGGRDLTGSQSGYAALVSSPDTVNSLTLTGSIAITGNISSVSINSSGNGIIGGQDLTGSQPGYAALVSSSGTVTALILQGDITTNGIINSVAINDNGNSIIGGQDLNGSQPGYAALISPSGTVHSLPLGTNMQTSGNIMTVAINSFGNAIIGGQDLNGSQPAYVALVSSSGIVTPLLFTGDMASSGWINSSALPGLISSLIPTTSLSGNNLTFANYINQWAPENAFYFIPSMLNGTLNTALESSAPTRNAASVYTANQNLFNLTTSFANHIRNQQSARLRVKSPKVAANNLPNSDEFLASLTIAQNAQKNPPLNPNSLWFEMIGALAYQKKQDQTVAFNPTTGGAILAYDRIVSERWRLGGGVSYLFTHIHEKEGQGHSNTNQEEAFIYSSWENRRFYIDTLLMAGAVQIDQVRNTRMTGFSFHSSSHPNGWQLLPHLELGLKMSLAKQSKTCQYSYNPLIMLDWANAWQGSYKEHGNSPFNAGQNSYYGSLLRTEAGVRFYETFFFELWNFSIQEKVSYVNTQSFNAGKVNAFLVGSPGSFTVETLSSAQNLGVGQIALTFDPVDCRYPGSTLFYQGEFGSQYQSHQLSVELGWDF